MESSFRSARCSRLIALAPLVILMACATNPLTGERQLMLVSTEQEEKMGLQVVTEYRNVWGMVEDPALIAFIRGIGDRLLRETPTPDASYEFFVVDQPVVNAFAAPGRKVFVTRALLLLVNAEEELAGVLGHEISHVIGRHTASRMSKAMGAQLLTLGATLGAAAAGGAGAADAATRLGGAGSALFVASYSRDQERESDHYGQGFAYAAGYDPTALTSFFESMDRYQELETSERRMPGWLDSHPATPERVATAIRRAAELLQGAAPPPRTSRRALLDLFDGLTVGPHPSEGVVNVTRLLHPDLDFTVLFPSGWKVQNSRASVAAISPQEEALIQLEVQGPGTDPAVAAAETLKEAGIQVTDQGPVQIAGRSAWRARTQITSNGKQLAVVMHWLPHEGSIFRFMGLTTPDLVGSFGAALDATPNSFRRLTKQERAEIRWVRMRVATARDGESLAELSIRTGNRWSAEETAVVNGLAVGARLRGGQLIKIARGEAYPGR